MNEGQEPFPVPSPHCTQHKEEMECRVTLIPLIQGDRPSDHRAVLP